LSKVSNRVAQLEAQGNWDFAWNVSNAARHGRKPDAAWMLDPPNKTDSRSKWISYSKTIGADVDEDTTKSEIFEILGIGDL